MRSVGTCGRHCIDMSIFAKPIPFSKKGGKEHDCRRWRIKGVRVGVAVKIDNDEQECPSILGTARGLTVIYLSNKVISDK